MTALVRPDAALAASWAEVVAESHDAGELHIHGSGLWELDELDVTEAGCRRVVEHLLAAADPAAPRPDGHVPCTYFWITDGPDRPDTIAGFLALRHTLTPWLLEGVGHIGYSVRPSRRREGHASRALALGVRAAADLGLDRVLVTCDDDNDGSRRTIERNGGVYEDTRNHKLRYWIATATAG